MAKYMLGSDSGTTSVKGCVATLDGKLVTDPITTPADGQIPGHSPQENWSEQDPKDLYEETAKNHTQLVKEAGIKKGDDVVVGLSAHMHGGVFTDAEGKPVYKIIMWDDTRTGEEAKQSIAQFGKVVDHMTVNKGRWLREHEPGIFEKVVTMFLPEDYLLHAMTGQRSTTKQGLSQMRAWDFENDRRDKRLLEWARINNLVPNALENMAEHGVITDAYADRTGLPKGTRITARLGDQQSSSTGVGAVELGLAGLTAGTSGVINIVAKADRDLAAHGVYKFLQSNDLGLIIACTFGCGASYQYGRDALCGDFKLVEKQTGVNAYDLMNELAAKAPEGSGGIVFLPYGNGGDRSPINDSTIRGGWLGIDYSEFKDKPDQQRAYLVRAILEGISHSFRHNQDVLKEAQDVELTRVRAAREGVLRSRLFAQMVSTNLGVPIEFVDTPGGCYGVMLAAGVGAGYFPSIEEACKQTIEVKGTVQPGNRDALTKSYNCYRTFVGAVAPAFATLARQAR